MAFTIGDIKQEIHNFYIFAIDAACGEGEQLTSWLLLESGKRSVPPLELIQKVKQLFPFNGMIVLEGLVIQQAGCFSVIESVTEDVVKLVQTLLKEDDDTVASDDLYNLYLRVFPHKEVELNSIDRHLHAKNLVNRIVIKAIVAKMLRAHH